MLHFRVKQYNLVLPTELIVHFGYDMKGSHLTFCIILKLKCVFFRSFTHNAHAKPLTSRTTKETSKVQSEHTQSLHYMNIRQFFTCLNCISPIKFHFATLDFALSHVISVNNRHFIKSDPNEKNSHGTKCY